MTQPRPEAKNSNSAESDFRNEEQRDGFARSRRFIDRMSKSHAAQIRKEIPKRKGAEL